MTTDTRAANEPAAPTVLVGHLDPVTGKMTWIAHECPLCMKAILDEEWQEHEAWHATGEA